MRLQTLSAKFAAIFVLGALAPLALVSTLLIQRLGEERQAALERYLELQSLSGERLLDRHLEGIELQARALASQPWMAQALREAGGGALQPWIVSLFAPEQGARALASEALRAAQETHWGLSHHVMLVNLEGHVTLNPERRGDAESHAGQRLPGELLEGLEGARMTGFFSFEEAKHFHALMLAPVESPSGERLGAVIIEINIEHILNALSRDLEEGVEVFLTTPAGRLIGRDKAKGSAALKHAGLEAAAAAKARVIGRFERDGAARFGVYFAHPRYPWRLGVEVPPSVIEAPARAAWLLGVGILLGGAALLALLGVWFGRRLSAPICQLVEVTEALAHGDVKGRASTHAGGELGQLTAAFNRSMDKTEGLIESARGASTQVHGASTQLLGEMEGLEGAVTTTFEALEGIDATLGRVEAEGAKSARAAHQIEEAAHAASSFAAEVFEHTQRLNDQSHEIAGDMQQLAAAIDEMAATGDELARIGEQAAAASASSADRTGEALAQMMTLNQRAQEIGLSVDLVNKLADRSKLLALNASIEAASAGSAGRGFAVVAKEVRELAQRTSGAVDQIASLFDDLRAATTRTKEEVEASAAESGQLNDLISQLAVAVTEQSSTTQDMAQTISGAAERGQQVASTVEVIQSRAQDTELIAAMAREVTGAAQALGELLEEARGRVEAARAASKETSTRARDASKAAAALDAQAEEMGAAIERFDA